MPLYSQTIVLGDTVPIYIHGKVFNSITKEPVLGTTIQFWDIDTNNFKKLGTVVSSLKDGSYNNVIVPDGSHFSLYIEKTGFYPESIIIEVSNITNRSDTKTDIYLIPNNFLEMVDTIPVYFHGKIFNSETEAPISGAIIQFWDIDTNNFKKLGTQVSSLKDGSFNKVIIPDGPKFCVYTEVPGFYPLSLIIEIARLPNRSDTKCDIFLIPDNALDSNDEVHFHDVVVDSIKIGDIIRLNNVFFDTDKSELKTESAAELNRLADYLKANPSIEIEISGHTDDIGTDSYNLTLSQQRVYSVIHYLMGRGINKKRMKGVGYGKTKPIVKNDNAVDRALNRRVEFKIIKK